MTDPTARQRSYDLVDRGSVDQLAALTGPELDHDFRLWTVEAQLHRSDHAMFVAEKLTWLDPGLANATLLDWMDETASSQDQSGFDLLGDFFTGYWLGGMKPVARQPDRQLVDSMTEIVAARPQSHHVLGCALALGGAFRRGVGSSTTMDVLRGYQRWCLVNHQPGAAYGLRADLARGTA